MMYKLGFIFCIVCSVSAGENIQDKVNKMEWIWSTDMSSVEYYIANNSGKYSVTAKEVINGLRGERDIIFADENGEVFRFKGSMSSAFIVKDNKLFYAKFDLLSPGCRIVAVDLQTKKELWNTKLSAVRVPMSSEYTNEINLKMMDGMIFIFGNESAGRYIEVLDITGAKLANRGLLANRDD